MENSIDCVYCRLCAETRHLTKVLNFDINENKCTELLTKLSFLRINVSLEFSPTIVVCLICFDSMNKAYDFINKAQKAQAVLVYNPVTTTTSETSNKNTLTDNNCPTFEEILGSQSTAPYKIVEQPNTASNSSIKIKIKIEESNYSSDNNTPKYNIQNLDENSLNVQEILDAALNSPFHDGDLEIYAKEIPTIPKTEFEIKTERKSSRSKTKTSKLSKSKLKLSKKKLKHPETEDNLLDLLKTEATWSSYPWICAYCKQEFHEVEALREHSKSAHGKCGAFTCVDCKYYGQKDDFNGFVKHVRKHRTELRDVCHYCDMKLSKPRCIPSHVTSHFPSPCLQCAACGEVQADEEAFAQHRQTYSQQPKKKRRKPNTPITDAERTCSICHNIYKTLNSLRDHIKTQHKLDRRKEFTCDRCGKMFYSKGTLTSHVMKHDNMRPHACRICTKSFLFPNQLRRHVESHTGVKPHACQHCSKRFRLRQQLLNHLVVHTDRMPYACQYCTKTFRFKQILTNHERSHTGCAPYQCPSCGMRFSCWSNYNKHMKRRHHIDTARKKITAQGVFPIDPVTGQVLQPAMEGLEEWKTQIMLPVKRGKKPMIKKENVENV